MKYSELEFKEQVDLALSLEEKLRLYINQYCGIAKTISLLADVYLIGGSIRDLMYDKVPKDYDFVVLGNHNKEWILDCFSKFNISYKINKLGGFKINVKGIEMDIWTTEDLFSSMQYNVDGLFYHVNTNSFVSFTFNDFKEKGLREINSDNNIQNGRERKLLNFSNKYFQ